MHEQHALSHATWSDHVPLVHAQSYKVWVPSFPPVSSSGPKRRFRPAGALRQRILAGGNPRSRSTSHTSDLSRTANQVAAVTPAHVTVLPDSPRRSLSAMDRNTGGAAIHFGHKTTIKPTPLPHTTPHSPLRPQEGVASTHERLKLRPRARSADVASTRQQIRPPRSHVSDLMQVDVRSDPSPEACTDSPPKQSGIRVTPGEARVRPEPSQVMSLDAWMKHRQGRRHVTEAHGDQEQHVAPSDRALEAGDSPLMESDIPSIPAPVLDDVTQEQEYMSDPEPRYRCPPNVKGQIIITGDLMGLKELVTPLREASSQDIVILSPAQFVAVGTGTPAAGDWDRCCRQYEGLYLIDGSPLRPDDLLRAGMPFASVVVVLSSASGGSQFGMNDLDPALL